MSGPRSEQNIRLLFVAGKPELLHQTLNFLGRRGWPIKITKSVHEALQVIVTSRPSHVLISVNLPNTNHNKVAEIFRQTFNIESILFAEIADPKTITSLSNSKLKYIVFPPISGPKVHRIIQRILKENSNTSHKNNEPIKEGIGQAQSRSLSNNNQSNNSNINGVQSPHQSQSNMNYPIQNQNNSYQNYPGEPTDNQNNFGQNQNSNYGPTDNNQQNNSQWSAVHSGPNTHYEQNQEEENYNYGEWNKKQKFGENAKEGEWDNGNINQAQNNYQGVNSNVPNPYNNPDPYYDNYNNQSIKNNNQMEQKNSHENYGAQANWDLPNYDNEPNRENNSKVPPPTPMPPGFSKSKRKQKNKMDETGNSQNWDVVNSFNNEVPQNQNMQDDVPNIPEPWKKNTESNLKNNQNYGPQNNQPNYDYPEEHSQSNENHYHNQTNDFEGNEFSGEWENSPQNGNLNNIDKNSLMDNFQNSNFNTQNPYPEGQANWDTDTLNNTEQNGGFEKNNQRAFNNNRKGNVNNGDFYNQGDVGNLQNQNESPNPKAPQFRSPNITNKPYSNNLQEDINSSQSMENKNQQLEKPDGFISDKSSYEFNPKKPVGKWGRESQSLLGNCLEQAVKSACYQVEGEIVPVQDTRKVKVISINSRVYKGFLVSAMGKDSIPEDELVKQIKINLKRNLKEKGHNLSDDVDFVMNITTENFMEVVSEVSDFVISERQEKEQLGIAYVSGEDSQPIFYESKQEDMIAIDINDIEPNVSVKFDVYIYLPKNEKYFKYLDKGRIITRSQLNRLARKAINNFHIKKTQIDNFKKFRGENYIKNALEAGEAKRIYRKKVS